MTTDEVIRFFKQNRYYLNTSQLLKYKVHTSVLRNMVNVGLLEQVKRGLYRLPAETLPEDEIFTYDYFDAAVAVPKGVFCLATALHYHGLTTQRPSTFDMVIPRSQRTPKLFTVSVRFYRFNEPYYSYGIQEINTSLISVKIYDKEKSVCDAFRQRRIIGEELAMESLHTYLMQAPKDINKLLATAALCRVKHLVEPVVKTFAGAQSV